MDNVNKVNGNVKKDNNFIFSQHVYNWLIYIKIDVNNDRKLLLQSYFVFHLKFFKNEFYMS